MSSIRISVHTPTYNRGHTLSRAYESLRNQNNHNFEWVVTDDGSTDNTAELFAIWCKEETLFPISYHKLPHGGLIRALNFGVNTVNGQYLFRLDSDDYLLPDAVEKLHRWITEIDDMDDIVGVGGVILTQEGKPIKGIYPKVDPQTGYVDATNLQRKYYDLDADMREAYKVEILKRYPFQVWETETFASEGLCLNEMALDGYKVRWHRDPIYVCEYCEDGLTKGSWNLLRRNPMGYAMMSNHRLKYQKGFVSRFQSATQHIALSIVGKNPQYILRSNALPLTLLVLPYGLALSLRRKIQFRYDDPVKRR